MTDTSARPETPPESATTASTQAEAGAQPAATPAPRETAEAPADAARALQEAAELKDKLLRALAEMENLRRRTEREVAEARSYGISAFARDILTVADNMHRALHALDAELREKADAGVKALLDGVELTERELMSVLEKHGVRKLDPLGQKFDPNLHQAMFEVPNANAPAGSVVQVMQAGYLIGERVLRPALVAVAKAAPKPPTEAPANNNVDVANSSVDTKA